MAGLTNQGLEIKGLTEVREDLRQEANTVFNDLVGAGDVLDTSSASLLGRMIGVVTPSESDLWEALLEIYNAFDPNSASGTALDNLVALAGIVRRGATPSTARLHFFGDYNITITSGSLVSSSFTNNRFEVPSDIILDENNVVGIDIGVQTVVDSTLYTATYNDGQNNINFSYTSGVSATESEILNGLRDAINNNLGSILTATVSGSLLNVVVDDGVTEVSWTLSGNLFFSTVTKGLTVIAVETGPLEQPAGTIDTISTPIFGWESVNQISAAVVGSLKETDSELRVRFNEAKFTRGSNILDSLNSDLIGLVGVGEVIIYENDTAMTDANGLPPHSFMAIIQGGLESDIGESIWNNKPAGIVTHGNTSFTIEDTQGNPKQVFFQRPALVDIYITVNLTVDVDFPPNGVERIKGALTQYIKDNAGIGEDVIYSRLYTPINSVGGHQVDSLFIDTSPSPTGTANLSIPFDSIAKLEIGNIEVNIT